MLRRRPFRSSRFLFLDPRRRRLPRKRQKLMASLFPSTRFEVLGAAVRLWGGGCSGYAAAKNVERGSGMLIGVTPPDPRCAAPGKGSVQALYACLPERCPVPREAAVGVDAGAGVPALQLRSLSVAGTDLPPLRSRERVLRREVRQHPSPRVPQARPVAVPAQPSRCDAAR